MRIPLPIQIVAAASLTRRNDGHGTGDASCKCRAEAPQITRLFRRPNLNLHAARKFFALRCARSSLLGLIVQLYCNKAESQHSRVAALSDRVRRGRVLNVENKIHW